ncbi:MAG: hypothetical protein CL678_15520 [Bdellovibrionaceae bacterium]|nr:hypothetical protein [Pseudobdellovibrionaceae bacterium]
MKTIFVLIAMTLGFMGLMFATTIAVLVLALAIRYWFVLVILVLTFTFFHMLLRRLGIRVHADVTM